MSRINRVPWGLQDILGASSQGDNPSDLLESVRPSFDMWPLWTMERVEYTRRSGTLNARGQSLLHEVPAGEYWIPITMSAHLAGNQDVGTTWSGRFVLDHINTPSTPVNMNLHYSQFFTSAVVGEIQGFSYNFPYKYVVGPGNIFGMFLTEYVAVTGNDSFEFAVLYTKMNA